MLIVVEKVVLTAQPDVAATAGTEVGRKTATVDNTSPTTRFLAQVRPAEPKKRRAEAFIGFPPPNYNFANEANEK